MRDNESIVQTLANCQESLRDGMKALLQADASPDTLQCVLEAMKALNHAVNSMGDRHHYGDRYHHGDPSGIAIQGELVTVERDSTEVIHAIALEAVEPIQKKLQALIERMENAGGGDRHE